MTQGNVLLTGLEHRRGAVNGGGGICLGPAQADVEKADLERERVALIEDPDYELSELAEGLENRGVQSDLALEVATQMTDHDALGAHAREERACSASPVRPIRYRRRALRHWPLPWGRSAAVCGGSALRAARRDHRLAALLALILLGARRATGRCASGPPSGAL